MKLDDLDILKFGNTIQIIGSIWQGEGLTFLCVFPGESSEDHDLVHLDMSIDDWKRFLRQTDIMETEVVAKAKDGGITKAIIRKSARQIDQRISWRVFKRDNYACRYCGNDDVPLTVDHLVLWEEGGPSIEDNLLSACKKCNRKRGNTPFVEWITDPYFIKVSKGLTASKRESLQKIVPTLDKIPKRIHKRSR